MQLSKIKYQDLILHYTKDDIDKLVFSKNQYNPKIKYDFAIVFGGTSMIPYRVEQALKLYNKKVINKIILSGGIGFLSLDRKKSEASKMQEYLLAKGVDEKDILLEDKSRNTYENILNCINLIKEYDIDKINILLITSTFHLKRCLKLMEHVIKNAKIYGIGVEDNQNDLANWRKNLKSKKNIYIEAILLIYYAKKHKIDD